MIHDQIKKYERAEVANQSTYWVLFELIWRDYFKFVCLKFGDRVFHRSGILGQDQPWSQNKEQFTAWAEGRTGVPFVDASSRDSVALTSLSLVSSNPISSCCTFLP